MARGEVPEGELAMTAAEEQKDAQPGQLAW
jgi:hypothetical protein